MEVLSFIVAFLLLAFSPSAKAVEDVFVSHGQMPDSTRKIMADLRDEEKRAIPLEVAIQARGSYTLSNPIAVTVTVTNLFDPPLVLNSRLLVNHRLLPGKLSFLIIDPNGKHCEIQRLVSPIDVRDEDFVLLTRGMSIQRTVDLGDFFKMREKGAYKVQATYHNSVDRIINGVHAWMGTLTSDSTDIELK